MKNFVLRLAMASVLGWVGASALISDNKDFWLQWGQMPELFKTGIGIAALFFQKFLPNVALPSLAKHSSGPGTYKVLNLQPAHIKFALRWLAGAAMIVGLAGTPYVVLGDLMGNDWKYVSNETIRLATIVVGAIPALWAFRTKTKRWDPVAWNQHSCHEIPKLPPLFKDVNRIVPNGVPQPASSPNNFAKSEIRSGGCPMTTPYNSLVGYLVKLKANLTKNPDNGFMKPGETYRIAETPSPGYPPETWLKIIQSGTGETNVVKRENVVLA